jgi:hypothetical protein
MTSRDPFDLANLRVDPTVIRPRRKTWHRGYVQFPWSWIDRLQSAQRVSTYRLALLLVYESWRTGRSAVVLSNVFAEAEGLSRRSKWNALAELESLGLVQVERHRRRSPRLTLLHLDREQS